MCRAAVTGSPPSPPHCLFVSQAEFPLRFPCRMIVSPVGPVQTTELGTLKPPVCQCLFSRSKTCSRGLMVCQGPYAPATTEGQLLHKAARAPSIPPAAKCFCERQGKWQNENHCAVGWLSWDDSHLCHGKSQPSCSGSSPRVPVGGRGGEGAGGDL